MKRIGYFVKDNGETIEDVKYIDDMVYNSYRHEWMAEEIAEYAYSHHYGWDWMGKGCVITVVIDGEAIGDFEIDIRYDDPSFYATEV